MRVLLDECLPRKLGRELPGHSVSTVSERGWSGVANGKLLTLAAGQCDVFITIDRLLAVQQTIPPTLAVITLHATSNRLSALLPLVPKLRDALLLAQSGEYGYQEVAAMLNVPVGTLKSRVFDARRQVKQRLVALGYVSGD